jgi:hypothetical protein
MNDLTKMIDRLHENAKRLIEEPKEGYETRGTRKRIKTKKSRKRLCNYFLTF